MNTHHRTKSKRLAAVRRDRANARPPLNRKPRPDPIDNYHIKIGVHLYLVCTHQRPTPTERRQYESMVLTGKVETAKRFAQSDMDRSERRRKMNPAAVAALFSFLGAGSGIARRRHTRQKSG